MTYKNNAILLIHATDCLYKLLGNICSVKLNFNGVTVVRLLKFFILFIYLFKSLFTVGIQK